MALLTTAAVHLMTTFVLLRKQRWPSPVAMRSAAACLLRSGFESLRGHGCLFWVLCVVRSRSLRQVDHSSRGVLLTVMRRCVWSRNLKNEEAMARVGPQRHGGGGREKKKKVRNGTISLKINTNGSQKWEETHMRSANSRGWGEVSNGLLSGAISSNAYFILRLPHVWLAHILCRTLLSLKLWFQTAVCAFTLWTLCPNLTSCSFLFGDSTTAPTGGQIHRKESPLKHTTTPTNESQQWHFPRTNWGDRNTRIETKILALCTSQERTPPNPTRTFPLRNHGFLEDGHKP